MAGVRAVGVAERAGAVGQAEPHAALVLAAIPIRNRRAPRQLAALERPLEHVAVGAPHLAFAVRPPGAPLTSVHVAIGVGRFSLSVEQIALPLAAEDVAVHRRVRPLAVALVVDPLAVIRAHRRAEHAAAVAAAVAELALVRIAFDVRLAAGAVHLAARPHAARQVAVRAKLRAVAVARFAAPRADEPRLRVEQRPRRRVESRHQIGRRLTQRRRHLNPTTRALEPRLARRHRRARQ